jgi:hypothetical protein
MTFYWVTLRYHATGGEITSHFESAIGRALWIIGTAQYADVLAQGEV